MTGAAATGFGKGSLIGSTSLNGNRHGKVELFLKFVGRCRGYSNQMTIKRDILLLRQANDQEIFVGRGFPEGQLSIDLQTPSPDGH